MSTLYNFNISQISFGMDISKWNASNYKTIVGDGCLEALHTVP